MLESGRGRVAAVLAGMLVSLVYARGAAADGLTYHVKPGDTLSGIASAYSVTVEAIVGLNGIADPDIILAGDILGIPRTESQPYEQAGWYTIQPGDTLTALAEKFGTSVSALQQANGLESDLIISGQRLVIPQGPVVDPLELLPAAPPEDEAFEGIIEEFAAYEGLDAGMLKAVAYVESGWDQGARSPAGAVGVMQLMPETAAWLERDVFGYELNEDTSVYDNVKAGTRLLKILLDASGDLDTALAAYYQGQGATTGGVLYEDTKGYVRFVQGVWEKYWR